jgi:hypothetical protein
VRFACGPAVVVALLVLAPALASEPFPFGNEMMLDAPPMQGSKRMPMIEVEEDGTASVDLWCVSFHAQVTVGGDTLSVVPQPPATVDAAPSSCVPERVNSDQALLLALAQITGWRRSGGVIEFSGPTTLRFRLMTN